MCFTFVEISRISCYHINAFIIQSDALTFHPLLIFRVYSTIWKQSLSFNVYSSCFPFSMGGLKSGKWWTRHSRLSTDDIRQRLGSRRGQKGVREGRCMRNVAWGKHFGFGSWLQRLNLISLSWKRISHKFIKIALHNSGSNRHHISMRLQRMRIGQREWGRERERRKDRWGWGVA